VFNSDNFFYEKPMSSQYFAPFWNHVRLVYNLLLYLVFITLLCKMLLTSDYSYCG
jgi:hypothetical protein